MIEIQSLLSLFVLLGLLSLFCSTFCSFSGHVSGCGTQLDMGGLVSAPCSEEAAESQLWGCWLFCNVALSLSVIVNTHSAMHQLLSVPTL